MATTEKYQKGGETIEETTWHNVTFFDKKAEILNKYVKKGLKIFIEGKQMHRHYEGQDGTRRYFSEIHGFGFEFLGSKQESKSTPDPNETDANGDTLPL